MSKPSVEKELANIIKLLAEKLKEKKNAK